MIWPRTIDLRLCEKNCFSIQLFESRSSCRKMSKLAIVSKRFILCVMTKNIHTHLILKNKLSALKYIIKIKFDILSLKTLFFLKTLLDNSVTFPRKKIGCLYKKRTSHYALVYSRNDNVCTTRFFFVTCFSWIFHGA